ncbi:P-loop containing nucleoside triphosphate hydrolase protein [Glomus cerebriforme]|uniref:P-loop containing nucleoside triphosphate hydrolase protein n=1 Tax=Glomus cerebriforme TaxID=658196 RepID=A0A397SJX3_9GLOM|nr:P-loop containing nucleoside triphosphate hydrolase protein [Glomus cerebriforme]
MSSIMIQSFRKNMLSHFITHKTLSFQPSKYALRNSNSYLSQSLFSKSYTTNKSEKLKPGSFDLKNEEILTNSYLYNINEFLLSGSLLFIIGNIIYVYYESQTNVKRISETMEKGIQLKMLTDKNYISRFKDIEKLKKIFQPNETHSRYHIIYGKPGVGKTELIKEVVNEIGKGIIYINIPSEPYNLDNEFKKAFNFIFEENISFLAYIIRGICGQNSDNSYYKWKKVLYEINHASKIYKEKYNKPPIIIYDNVDYLFHNNLKIFNMLQDDAKDNANNEQYIAVFIVNEKDVFDKMKYYNYWTYRDIMEIGNLSKEESMKYLVDICKIKKEIANKSYELVDGHIIELRAIVDKLLNDKLSFEVIKQQKFFY